MVWRFLHAMFWVLFAHTVLAVIVHFDMRVVLPNGAELHRSFDWTQSDWARGISICPIRAS